MGVHKSSKNSFSDKSDEVATQNSKTMSTFGSQATGNAFGRQSDSIFGTFPRQNHEETEGRNSAFGTCSGTQPTFGGSSFQNRGYFQQPLSFGFGSRPTTSPQVTEICFTGFGEPKTNYNFNNTQSSSLKEITLTFKNPDTASIFGKPDIMVVIQSELTHIQNWTSKANDFSFSVGRVEKYNSSFVMKSPWPTKFSVKVKSGSIFGMHRLNRREFGSSSNRSGNRKITLTFPSGQPYCTSWNNFQRSPPSTVVEIPIRDDLELLPEVFSFSVSPSKAFNAFEVQTSENSIFKITFSENEQNGFGTSHFGNRSTGNGPVFFNHGRQLNDFPNSSGYLFGQPTSAPAFDSYNPLFGSSSLFVQCTHPPGSNQSSAHIPGEFNTFPFGRPINTIPNTNNSIFGQSGNTSFQPSGIKEPSIFGQKPSFNNSGGVLFGQGSNNVNSKPLFGNGNLGSKAVDLSLEPNNQANSLFGHPNPSNKDSSNNFGTPFFAYLRPPTGQHTFSPENSKGACGFGANNSFGNSKTPTHTELSVQSDQNIGLAAAAEKYQPIIGSDFIGNGSAPIQTKMHSITAMKEHLNKSFEELRLQSFKEDSMRLQQHNMANPHCNNQESIFEAYNPSHNVIGNINGSTPNQPCVANEAMANFSKFKNLSNKEHFANDDKNVKTKKPRHLRRSKESKSANEFYEDVFKYMDYIRRQYGHLENSRNYKNENNAKDEAIKTWNNYEEQSSMPTFGRSTCSAVKTGWEENRCPIAAQSKNSATPQNDPRENVFNVSSAHVALRPTNLSSSNTAANTNNTNETSHGGSLFGTASSNKIAKTVERSLTCKPLDEADANFGQLPFTPGKLHDLSAKPKECEQQKLMNIFGCGGEKPFGIPTAINNEASQAVFFPIFSPKDSGDLDDSNAAKSGEKPFGIPTVSNNKASQAVFFPIFSPKDSGDLDDSSAAKSEEKPFGIPTVSNNKASHVVIFPKFSPKDSGDLDDSKATNSRTTPSSTRFCLFKGPFLAQAAFTSKPDALFTKSPFFSFKLKERNNSEKDTNDDGSDSGGLKIAEVQDSFRTSESKDNEAKATEKNNCNLQLQDVPMCEPEALDSANRPTNSQAFKMKKISEELAALVVDGCENDSKRKDSDAGSDISNFSIISNQSLNEDGKPKEHPTGIIMTRSGYYTEPSLEELTSLMTEDGRCNVPNFKIGRKGYGSILFNKEMNVAGLNVDEIVHFRNKEIIIYPKQKDQSLVKEADLNNCEALITLEQVWPHDKTKHEPMKDPERLDEMKYEDKLRLVCDKNDIHFVEYLPETGRWIFKMKQFVKNNINCWDEEDDAPEVVNISTGPSAEIKQLEENTIMTDTETGFFGKPSI